MKYWVEEVELLKGQPTVDIWCVQGGRGGGGGVGKQSVTQFQFNHGYGLTKWRSIRECAYNVAFSILRDYYLPRWNLAGATLAKAILDTGAVKTIGDKMFQSPAPNFVITEEEIQHAGQGCDDDVKTTLKQPPSWMSEIVGNSTQDEARQREIERMVFKLHKK